MTNYIKVDKQARVLAGRVLQEIRKKQKLTQREVNEKLGFKATSTYSGWELGTNQVPTHMLEAVADALNQDPAVLIPTLMRHYEPVLARYMQRPVHPQGKETNEHVNVSIHSRKLELS